MKRVLEMLTAKWFVTLLGALALALVVWFVGPLIAVADVRPLEGDITRMLVLMAILVAWGLLNILSRVKAAQTNQQLVAKIAEPDKGGAAAGESEAEIAVLRGRLEEALEILKKSSAGKGRRRYLYQLPWYMLIGPPGSGKTTALQNSGLNFPLSAKYGKDPVKGVGGTRNCDWWFTDDAVLIDTAGRYTTQDSQADADHAAWDGFLGLLKKFRPRQPINGALVAISIGDLAALSPEQRAAHAHAIRQRLKELADRFGIRPPVYVLFTKADLIAGFEEFFDDLGREEREQVWGLTLPMDPGGEKASPAVTGVAAELDALLKRLNDRLLERIQHETDLGKRALIYSFPTQFASLKDPIQEFLNEIFLPNRYEGRALLRGVYFTSGTQEGTPIDRLMSAMAASFGLDRQRLTAHSGAGRGYFLTRLLRGVVFAEANIAGADPRADRRQMWLRRGAYAATVLAVVVGAAAWTISYLGNRALIAAVDGKLADYVAAATPVATQQVGDGDVLRVLPALNLLRTMPAGYEARHDGEPFTLGFGLYQGRKLAAREVAAYRSALNRVFLPRLLNRLGDQIRSNLGRPDYVNEALKVYLMLGTVGPLDKDLVRAWMDLDWKTNFAGADKEATRSQLAQHLDALLEEPIEPIALDGTTISQARRTLLQSPLASRAYNAIKQSAAARQVPEWRISDHAGPAADRVFVRSSGKPLSEGLPGLYTDAGFYKAFLPATVTVARDMARERWVLGDAAPSGGDAAVTSTLERDVIQLYMADYTAQWDRLLADIAIVPFRSMQQAAQVTNLLSGPDSPLKLLLVAVARETQLTRPPEQPAGGAGGSLIAAAQSAQAAANQAAAGAANRLAAVVGQPVQPQAPVYGQQVEDHFRKLQDFVGPGGAAPAPIDDVVRSLNNVYLTLNRLGQPGQDLVGKGGADAGAAQKLASDATRLPAPVGALVAAVARNASTLTVGGARAQINDEWQSKVLPFCRQALENRYPIYRTGTTDVTLDDFTKLFAPAGLIDGFFAVNLKPFVDTARLPWRWQKVDDVDLGIAPDVLLQFQRAAAIRNGLFSGNAAAPSLKFELRPVSLDATATQALIQIDGQDISYAHGPVRPTPVQWPGTSGIHEARVAFSPTISGEPSSIAKSGFWALFRLFDEVKVDPTEQPDRLRMTVGIGSRKAVYELQASSVINPLTMPELREFRCPARL